MNVRNFSVSILFLNLSHWLDHRAHTVVVCVDYFTVSDIDSNVEGSGTSWIAESNNISDHWLINMLTGVELFSSRVLECHSQLLIKPNDKARAVPPRGGGSRKDVPSTSRGAFQPGNGFVKPGLLVLQFFSNALLLVKSCSGIHVLSEGRTSVHRKSLRQRWLR